MRVERPGVVSAAAAVGGPRRRRERHSAAAARVRVRKAQREGKDGRRGRGEEKRGKGSCRCRRRVAVVEAAPTSRRRRADAAPPCPIAAASRRGAETPPREMQRHSVAVSTATAPVCTSKNKMQAQKTPRRDLNRRPPNLINYQPDTTACQGSRHFQCEFQVHKATCAQKQEREVT